MTLKFIQLKFVSMIKRLLTPGLQRMLRNALMKPNFDYACPAPRDTLTLI